MLNTSTKLLLMKMSLWLPAANYYCFFTGFSGLQKALLPECIFFTALHHLPELGQNWARSSLVCVVWGRGWGSLLGNPLMFCWHLMHARAADQTTSEGVRQKERSEHFYFKQYLRGPPSAPEIKDYYPSAWPIRQLFAAMWHPTNHRQTGPKFMTPFGGRCRQRLQCAPVRDSVTRRAVSNPRPRSSALIGKKGDWSLRWHYTVVHRWDNSTWIAH